jgi:hypothetical protein
MKVYAAAVILVCTLAATAIAGAAEPAATTFVAVLTPEAEVPACTTATNAAGGVAVFHVVDEATGTVSYRIVTHNLPGTTFAAHIHVAPAGVAGPIVQPTPITPGADNGVIGEGTFSDPALLAAIRADPQNYYVNVHTSPPGVGCPSGAARGQLDEQGPSNN